MFVRYIKVMGKAGPGFGASLEDAEKAQEVGFWKNGMMGGYMRVLLGNPQRKEKCHATVCKPIAQSLSGLQTVPFCQASASEWKETMWKVNSVVYGKEIG